MSKVLARACWLSLSVLATFGEQAVAAGTEDAKTADKTIAFSISYAGNAMRQGQIKAWEATTTQAVADGIIKKTKVVTAHNGAPEQASQIETLILEGWSAIVINAGSPAALNGVIKEACAANIVVVEFDGIATTPCAYKVEYNWKGVGSTMATYVANKLHGKGNVLENRGIAGISIDEDMHDGATEVLAKDPGVKIVGTVYGAWTPSITQREISAILPSLPQVDAVISQGGGFGAYQAFADAGRKQPIMVYGNYQEELKVWSEMRKKDPNYQAISLSSSPTVSSVAFWVAQQVLSGKSVPKTVDMPINFVDPAKLDQLLAKTQEGGVASPDYSRGWVEQLVAANMNHTSLPATPEPR